MSNHLKGQTSPYLLQHAENPVDWYPWGEEAFAKARSEDKPIFLSIGYSTCHWCHVMAHESFEDEEVARLLNEGFVSIKVDKEERPDIDSVYMAVCQAFTGQGGWPTSIFMTPDQLPFYAGTYFPKTSHRTMVGLVDLLQTILAKWGEGRDELLRYAGRVVEQLRQPAPAGREPSASLAEYAANLFKRSFDAQNGGFGPAPKFPMPHNLLFLLGQYEREGDGVALAMAEKTLTQMYRGGLFDHVGFGFSRYSTDELFLVPHFEKMLYDNALMIMAYSKAFATTGKGLYREVAQKTAHYVLKEMTSPEGAFYSAQDADSEGVEGRFYLFEPEEVIALLGDVTGRGFNNYFGVTELGNFEGKNILNLLGNDDLTGVYDVHLPKLYEYRKKRYLLHLDDKVLTSWNGLMVSALCLLYRVTADEGYLDAARKARAFVEGRLAKGGRLLVSYRDGKASGLGFLDDYACHILALVGLYEATLQDGYLEAAGKYMQEAVSEFWDEDEGGFFLYGKGHEQLITKPKDTFDGAIPSGNSVMAYNLAKLSRLVGSAELAEKAEAQMEFMSRRAAANPMGFGFFLLALAAYEEPLESITVALGAGDDVAGLPTSLPLDADVTVLREPSRDFPLVNGRTTFYCCRGKVCLPPTNELPPARAAPGGAEG